MSVTASGKFQYPVGKAGARALGYDPALIESAPEQFFASSCGVGNPFSLGGIRKGEALLDLGCGAGLDLYVADRLMGGAGQLYGVDLTEEMVQLARKNLALAGVKSAEIRRVDSEVLPYGDRSFDVVISNGVINLAPDKEALFRELCRVLKPGGRLQFADVMLEKDLPAELAGSADAWSQ